VKGLVYVGFIRQYINRQRVHLHYETDKNTTLKYFNTAVSFMVWSFLHSSATFSKMTETSFCLELINFICLFLSRNF